MIFNQRQWSHNSLEFADAINYHGISICFLSVNTLISQIVQIAITSTLATLHNQTDTYIQIDRDAQTEKNTDQTIWEFNRLYKFISYAMIFFSTETKVQLVRQQKGGNGVCTQQLSHHGPK
jgi:hypothetical protein